MNLRFWGGWFLALAGIAILLTMGCEKGALGVKTALVTGKIVDKDNPSLGVANAVVKMMSKEQVGTSELKQGNNFASTVTNANGDFIFENVTPDNVVFEIEASGYAKAQFPEVTAAATEEGETALTAVVDKVYVKSGSVTSLGAIALRKISSPLPTTITAKIVLRDSKTLEMLKDDLNNDGSPDKVTISFNSQVAEMTPTQWRDVGTTLNAESSFKVMVRAAPDFYLAKEETLSGAGNIQTDIHVTPVTYNILLRCINVPDYIEGGVVNVYAETIKVGKPPQVIATHTIDDLGGLSAPNLPEVIEVPGLALPVNLRIQVRGYNDEVVVISGNNLPEGTMGSYRVDVDFLYDNGTTNMAYDPSSTDLSKQKAGLFDNQIKRDVILRVAGPHLVAGDSVTGFISLPSSGVTYTNVNGVSVGTVSGLSDGSLVDITFRDSHVGYNMNYTVSVNVNPDPTSPSYASGSYVLTNEEPIMVNPPIANPATGLIIGVKAERPE